MYSSNMLWRDKSSNIICFPKKLKKVHLLLMEDKKYLQHQTFSREWTTRSLV